MQVPSSCQRSAAFGARPFRLPDQIRHRYAHPEQYPCRALQIPCNPCGTASMNFQSRHKIFPCLSWRITGSISQCQHSHAYQEEFPAMAVLPLTLIAPVHVHIITCCIVSFRVRASCFAMAFSSNDRSRQHMQIRHERCCLSWRA